MAQVVDAQAFEPHFARRDAARRLEQPDDRRAGQRLAGTGLADDTEDFTALDVEGNVVDCEQRAPRVGNSMRRLRTSSSGAFAMRQDFPSAVQPARGAA